MGTNPRGDQSMHDPEDVNDPLADNIRIRQSRQARRSSAAGVPPNPGPHNRRTLMDNDFANRAQVRRHRQPTSPFSTQRFESISGSDNTRKLFIAGLAILGLALIFLFIRILGNAAGPGGTDSAILVSPSPLGGVVGASPGPIAEDDLAASPQSEPEASPAATEPEASPVATEPETSPAAEPSAENIFVVSGTEGQGLRLREGPSTEANVIGTLADGTEVEVTDDISEAEGYEWRRVITTEFGEGWVAADFLSPAQ